MPKDFIPDKEVDVFHDDLYSQEWQSDSEDFAETHSTSFQSELTITIPESPEEQLAQRDTQTLDTEDPPSVSNPDDHPEDTVLNVGGNNHESEIPPSNPTGKVNKTYEQTPQQTGKRIMRKRIIIRSTLSHKTEYLIIRKDHRLSY